MKFHDKLYTLRKGAGMTQTDLAAKLNVSRQAVSRWEMGSAMPDVENLIAMSDLFGVTLDDLLKNKEDAPEGENAPSKERGPRFWDFVPKLWWIPAVLTALCKAVALGMVFLLQFFPETAIGMTEWTIEHMPRWVLFLLNLPAMNTWSVMFLGITGCCFLWALLKWWKVRT